MIDDYSAITSEIMELERLLSTIPKDNVIDRMSLEHRLEVVMASLANMLEKNFTPSMNLICMPEK